MLKYLSIPSGLTTSSAFYWTSNNICKMGLIAALIVNGIGLVVILTGGILMPIIGPLLGFSSTGIVAGSLGAAAQSYYGNLAAGSIISVLTSAAMAAPTP